LLGMYQNLLIEKEQRLRNFMHAHQDGLVDHNVILASRSWRLLMALHRIRYNVSQLFKRKGGAR